MSEPIITRLKRRSWLRRVLQVRCAQGDYQIEYSSRNLVRERVFVNEQVEIERRISSWFSPIFRFFVGSRPAVVAVRVSPWATIGSFHLLIDGQVLYCDRRQDLFDDDQPRRLLHDAANRSASSIDGPDDPLCPYCDRLVRGVGQDFSSVPAEWTRADSPIGIPKAVFTFARQHRLSLIVAGILASICGLALLAGLWFVPVGNFGAEMHGRHSMLILGALLLGVGPVAFFYALRTRRLLAVTGSEGIALIENEFVSFCRWDDIATVHEVFALGGTESSMQAAVRGEDHILRVRCRDGTEMVFRNLLDDLVWLGKIIQQETLPYLFPSALAQLKNGEVLSFGPLTLDAEGLSAGPDKRLSWPELDEVRITKGFLTVTRVGKRWSWFKTPVGQVANAHVLLALVRLSSRANVNGVR